MRELINLFFASRTCHPLPLSLSSLSSDFHSFSSSFLHVHYCCFIHSLFVPPSPWWVRRNELILKEHFRSGNSFNFRSFQLFSSNETLTSVSSLFPLFLPFSGSNSLSNSDWCNRNQRWYSPTTDSRFRRRRGQIEGNLSQEGKTYPAEWWSTILEMHRNRISTSHHNMVTGCFSHPWNTSDPVWGLRQVCVTLFYSTLFYVTISLYTKLNNVH